MIALTFKRTRFLAPVIAFILAFAPLVSKVSAQDFDDGTSHNKATAAAPAKSSNTTYADARTDAQRDVESDISGGGWFAAGFLCGVFGWLFAYLSDSKPPVSRIMGKDSDYVLAYSSEYESAAKSVKTSKSLIGCLVGTVVSIVVQVAIISSSSSSN
jgi:hypothetical protein